MNTDVDYSAIPPLVVFEEPLASFSSLSGAVTPSHDTTRASTAAPPLVVTSLCFDEVASDVVLLTNENTICFYHLTLSRAASATPAASTRAATNPEAGSFLPHGPSSPPHPPPPPQTDEDVHRLADMTDLALCLTVQRRLPSTQRAREAHAASGTGSDAAATVSVRAARRCPTTFFAPTVGDAHISGLTESETSSLVIAYQIVAVSCEASAIYFYRCFNAQSELTEAALTTAAADRRVPLAAFAVYQCVPHNLRFSEPCYPIHSFYWVVPSDGCVGRVDASGEPGPKAPAMANATPAPRMLCITSIGLELIRLGRPSELDAAAYHQSTHGAEGLPTLLTLHHGSAAQETFTSGLLGGWARLASYPTRVDHWYYHPTTRLLLVLRDDPANVEALRKFARAAPNATAEPVLNVVLKPFEVSPDCLRPMCRLELPSPSCADLVRALHNGQPSAVEDPRMLASRALGAHVGIVLLYGSVFVYHVVACDAVVVLYQYCPAAPAHASSSSTAQSQHGERLSRPASATSLGSGSSFQITRTGAPPGMSTAASSSAIASMVGGGGHARTTADLSRETNTTAETYQRRLVLDLRTFPSFRNYSDCHTQRREAGAASSVPVETPPPPPPALAVQVCDNLLVLHAVKDETSAVFDVAALASCVEAEHLTQGGALDAEQLVDTPRENTVLRLNAVLGPHARPVALPCSLPPPDAASGNTSADFSNVSGEWVSVPPSAMASRTASVAQSLYSQSTRGGRSASRGSGLDDDLLDWPLDNAWSSSIPRATPRSPFAEESAAATPRRRRVPVGLHVYHTTRVALQPRALSPSAASVGGEPSVASKPSPHLAAPARRTAAPRTHTSTSHGGGGGGGLAWLLGKLPTSLTGLDQGNDNASGNALFGAPTPLCRAESQLNTPVPFMPALVTAPLIPQAATPATDTGANDCLRQWYTACGFSGDGSTLPLVFAARQVTPTSPPTAPNHPRPSTFFSVHLIHVSPFAVAAAASARMVIHELSAPNLCGDLDTFSTLASRDVVWRVSFYLRRLFCCGEAVPRMLRAMLRCTEMVGREAPACVYSPEACPTESIAAALTAVVEQQASVRCRRRGYMARANRLAMAPTTTSTSSTAAAASAACLSEWDVYPGPALGMSSSAFVDALRLAAQVVPTVATTAGSSSACTLPRRECRVFTNRPDCVPEAVPYLAHFTAPPLAGAPPHGSQGFLSLLDVLTTCLLPPSSYKVDTPPPGTPRSDMVSSPSSLLSPSSSVSATPTPTPDAGSPLRVYRSFQQKQLVELVLEPAVQSAHKWAVRAHNTPTPPVREPTTDLGFSSRGSAAAAVAAAPLACRERFVFLLTVLLAYSGVLRDVGEPLTDDVQVLTVTVLMASFPGSLKSLGRTVHKCLRRGLLQDRLSTALRLLQHRDAWIASQARQTQSRGPGSPLASPVRLLSHSGFDPQQVQDPLSSIVMGMLARCGGVYERLATWLRRRDPLRAARDLCRHAASVPYEVMPISETAGGATEDSVLFALAGAAEEDSNLLLASQDILQCAASSVDEAEMGLMGPRRWSGCAVGALLSSPTHHSVAAGCAGSHAEAGGGSRHSAAPKGHGSCSDRRSDDASHQQRERAAFDEHASRKSRQHELQACRKQFVLVFQLLNCLVRSRVQLCYARQAALEAHLATTAVLEDEPMLNPVLTSVHTAEKMEAKLVEYERRFIAVLHS